MITWLAGCVLLTAISMLDLMGIISVASYGFGMIIAVWMGGGFIAVLLAGCMRQ